MLLRIESFEKSDRRAHQSREIADSRMRESSTHQTKERILLCALCHTKNSNDGKFRDRHATHRTTALDRKLDIACGCEYTKFYRVFRWKVIRFFALCPSHLSQFHSLAAWFFLIVDGFYSMWNPCWQIQREYTMCCVCYAFRIWTEREWGRWCE